MKWHRYRQMGTDQISRQFGHKETNILRYSDAIARVSEIAAVTRWYSEKDDSPD